MPVFPSYWNPWPGMCCIITYTNSILYLDCATVQYQSRIRVFFNLYLHQQFNFDNSQYTNHAKLFVLSNEFLVGHHLEMWHSCIVVPDPHSFIAIVFIKSRDWHCNSHTSHFKMSACRKFNDQNKSLGRSYIHKIIKFELLNM